jgi:hypothetical protein
MSVELDLIAEIKRMRKDPNRGDDVFRCGFNGALDNVIRLIEASAAPAEGREAVDERAAFAKLRGQMAYIAAYSPDEADSMSKDRLAGRLRAIIERARAALATAPTMSEAVRTTHVPRYAKPPIGFVLEIGGAIRWQWATDTQAGAEGMISRLHYNTAPADRKPYRIVPLVEAERIDRANAEGEKS